MAKATKLKWEHYGMPVYKTDDGKEWAVGTEAQADRAARQNILDSLWAFNTDFIGRFAELDDDAEKALGEMQRKMSEGANSIVRRIIGERNLGRFVREAIAGDGRSHFMSSYDDDEYDSDDIEGLPKGKVAYRLN